MSGWLRRYQDWVVPPGWSPNKGFMPLRNYGRLGLTMLGAIAVGGVVGLAIGALS